MWSRFGFGLGSRPVRLLVDFHNFSSPPHPIHNILSSQTTNSHQLFAFPESHTSHSQIDRHDYSPISSSIDFLRHSQIPLIPNFPHLKPQRQKHTHSCHTYLYIGIHSQGNTSPSDRLETSHSISISTKAALPKTPPWVFGPVARPWIERRDSRNDSSDEDAQDRPQITRPDLHKDGDPLLHRESETQPNGYAEVSRMLGIVSTATSTQNMGSRVASPYRSTMD
jgi:hypothetical protein